MRIQPENRWNLSLSAFAPVWVLAAILAAILLLGASVLLPTVEADNGDVPRGIDADAARYRALGEYYQAQSATAADSIQRGLDAAAARYEAMRDYYQAQSVAASDGIQRGLDAAAARYEAMRDYYQAQSATASDGIQRGIDAGAARYEAMHDYYLALGSCPAEDEQVVTGPAFVFHRRATGC